MQILYFAWVRQKVGLGQESLDLPEGVTDVAGLVRHLAARSPGHAAAFAHARQIRAAVNQEFCAPDQPLQNGDEVAFFPPVTGG